MFDHVIKKPPAHRRRRTGSLILSLAMVATAASALTLTGNQLVEEAGEIAVIDFFPEELRAGPRDERPPRAARKLGLTSEDCQVRIGVDTRGRPTEIEILSCPSVFHDELMRAARQWRFYPAEAGGQPIPARTVIPVHFRLY